MSVLVLIVTSNGRILEIPVEKLRYFGLIWLVRVQNAPFLIISYIISPRLTKAPLIQCSTAPYNTIDRVE